MSTFPNFIEMFMSRKVRKFKSGPVSYIYGLNQDSVKYSFPACVVNIWNSLPNVVVLASSVDTFKNRLDRFWGNQDVKYTAESEPEVDQSFI